MRHEGEGVKSHLKHFPACSTDDEGGFLGATRKLRLQTTVSGGGETHGRQRTEKARLDLEARPMETKARNPDDGSKRLNAIKTGLARMIREVSRRTWLPVHPETAQPCVNAAEVWMRERGNRFGDNKGNRPADRTG